MKAAQGRAFSRADQTLMTRKKLQAVYEALGEHRVV